MSIIPISEVIPESNLVFFSPHYDDFLLGLGGYALALQAAGLRPSKRFHIVHIFSRSNYQVNGGADNYDKSLERIKYATGRRLIEELDCMDELLGAHAYRYELLGELECLLRGKVLAEDVLEFPHGMFPDFSAEDWQIFERVKQVVAGWVDRPDTALVFPLAIKEHLDHFITREAGIAVAEEAGEAAKAAFYFQEDKPYAGLQEPPERARIEEFIQSHRLEKRVYACQPEEVAALAFKHYTSQVDDSYRQGVLGRAEELRQLYQSSASCDQIFRFGS
jgi:hypothetical protein